MGSDGTPGAQANVKIMVDAGLMVWHGIRMDYKIEQVGLPSGVRSGSKYPFRGMEVGDSFLVEGDKATRSKAIQAAYACSRKKGYDVRFVTKTFGESVRIYAVAKPDGGGHIEVV